jgi:hypothetical protein
MEQTVTRPHPQPFFTIFYNEHPVSPLQRSTGMQTPEAVHRQIGYEQRAFVRKKIKIMPGVLINDPDFLLMDKSLRKYIRTKLFRRRVPDTYAIFRTNPSFTGRVKIDFVDIAFRKPGIGTGIVSHLPAVFITINALRSSYP